MNQSFRNTFFLPASRTRRTVRWVRRLVLALLLPLLLLAALGQWWLLPRLNDYRNDLAGALQNTLHVPVRIEAMTATVEGWRLALQLQGVSLDDPERDATFAHFNQVAITLNLWRSLREWRPVVRRVRLEGASVTLQDNLLRLKPDASKSSSLSEVAHQIFGLRQLEIVGEQLAIRRADGAAWQLLNPYLRLQDTARGRRLALTADLPTDPGERLELTVEPLSTDKAAGEMSWRLQGQVHFADQSGQALTPTEFEATQTGTGWQAIIRHLRAEDLLAWTAPWLDESARQWLTPLDPRGELPEVTLQSESATGAYHVTASLNGINVHSTHGLPGFENVTGQIQFTPEQGRIELDSRAVQVDTAGLLRAPITLDSLSGIVNWRRSAEGLQVASTGLELANADLNGRFWGSVTVPEVGGSVLDIQGRYHDVKVKQAWRYLPVAVIPPQGIHWLDRALVDGQVTTGELMFRGPPGAFPFDRDEGLFETRFQVEDAVLDYAPGWPRLEQLEAEVRFRNRGLTVTASSGRLLDGMMEGATTRIRDLAKVVVQVEGRAKGPGASMWRMLKASPLGGKLGEDLPNLQISGSNTLDLELTLPIDERPGQARGRVGLLNNDIKLPAWKVELERLRGEVRFTQADLEAKNVTALWRGTPIRLDLDLAGREGRRELRTQIQGKLGLPALIGQSSATALEAQMVGVSNWKAVLTAPTHRREQSNDKSPISLELSSDLRGTTIDLPAPLGKAASTARPLKIRLQPDEGNRWVVALEYEPGVRAMLELTSLLNTPQFERGELRVGAGPAQLPDEPGLAIIADLPRWEWASPAKAPSGSIGENRECASAKTQDQGVNPLALVRRVEARIDELVVAGQSFAKMTIHAHRNSQGLWIELESPDLSGHIAMPDKPTPAQPVDAALQRLQIQHETAGATPKKGWNSATNPCRLPPVEVTVADLRMNEQNLGRLQMTVMPRPGGVQLSGIELNSQQQQIDARAEWWWNGGDPISRLNIALRSPELAETLAMFGYPRSGIAGGPTRAQLKAEWAAGLPDFTLERISGTLKFQIGSGQLLEIKPGLGRMIGLFNVQNLQRRLSLDFSDLFQPGTSFDEISGEFTFKNGQARTDNLSIEAPAAQIDIQGRVGLKDRDFNQQITVTPELGGTLPIAGAIVGGPAAGAAVFVAERLLQKNIEQVTRYQYRLTGSWDDPVLEPLNLQRTPIEQTPIETPHTPSRPQHGFASDN